jgi:hypothetical protein
MKGLYSKINVSAPSITEYKAFTYSKFKLCYLGLTINLIIAKVCITKIVILDLYLEILSHDQTFILINYIL